MTYAMRRACAIGLLVLSLMTGVARAAGKPFIGLASWYGKQHHGKKMANGQRFDRFKLTAAHRTLRFGTLLQVCLARTGLCTVVEVTDRGPWIKTRALDLSEAAARKIGLLQQGVGRVTFEPVE